VILFLNCFGAIFLELLFKPNLLLLKKNANKDAAMTDSYKLLKRRVHIMKHIKTALSIALLLSGMVLLSGGGLREAIAQEKEGAKIRPELKNHVLRIIDITKDMPSPVKTEVAPGTTVVWHNGTASIVELKFTGKQITMACEAPVNFFANEEGSFSSYKILPYAVASMCFIGQGSYDYKMIFGSSGPGESSISRTLSGTVAVK
jgi:hypothetical protein